MPNQNIAGRAGPAAQRQSARRSEPDSALQGEDASAAQWSVSGACHGQRTLSDAWRAEHWSADRRRPGADARRAHHARVLHHGKRGGAAARRHAAAVKAEARAALARRHAADIIAAARALLVLQRAGAHPVDAIVAHRLCVGVGVCQWGGKGGWEGRPYTT
jgi:hypothetical protein